MFHATAAPRPQIETAGFVALVSDLGEFLSNGLLGKSLTERQYPAIDSKLIAARRAFRDDPTGLEAFNNAQFSAGEDELEIYQVSSDIVLAWYAEYQAEQARKAAELAEIEAARQLAAEAVRIKAEKLEAEQKAVEAKVEQERQAKVRRNVLLQAGAVCTCGNCHTQMVVRYGRLPSVGFMRQELGREPTVADLTKFVRFAGHAGSRGYPFEDILDEVLSSENQATPAAPKSTVQAKQPAAAQSMSRKSTTTPPAKAEKPRSVSGFGSLGSLFPTVAKIS
jgi:hypothetical protein